MVDRAEPDLEALTAASFEPVSIRRDAGARVRLVTAAWVLALAGVAGLAVVGRLTEPGTPDAATPAEAHPSAATPPVGASMRLAAPDPLATEAIVVTSPAEGDPTITAAEIIVQGFLNADAASLRVSLETESYGVDQATVVPAPAVGGQPHAAGHARFLVRFGIPEPRRTVPMVVRVVALDRDGNLLADVRQPFRLGPIERPTLGDDGLLGSLVFTGG